MKLHVPPLRVMSTFMVTLPLAATLILVIAGLLPFDAAGRLALVYALAIPLWCALACWVAVLRNPHRAWAVCLLLSAVMAFGLDRFAP